MKRFILSDLHIGYPGSQYAVMAHAIDYIRRSARPGDEVLGLGDWWHMNEKGMAFCLRHPMTQQFRDLASRVPVRIIPGNHDHHLEKYRGAPEQDNPVSPIRLIAPFEERGLLFCHGHEYDPVSRYAGWLLALWARLIRKRTPSYLKRNVPTEEYLLAVYFIYSRATLALRKKSREEGREYKGIVMGHTHLPFFQQTPELPLLLDDGDMRHNATFVLQDENRFDLLKWQEGGWRSVFSLEVP